MGSSFSVELEGDKVVNPLIFLFSFVGCCFIFYLIAFTLVGWPTYDKFINKYACKYVRTSTRTRYGHEMRRMEYEDTKLVKMPILSLKYIPEGYRKCRESDFYLDLAKHRALFIFVPLFVSIFFALMLWSISIYTSKKI